MVGQDAAVVAICIISALVLLFFIIGLLCGSNSATTDIVDVLDDDKQGNGDIPISEVDFTSIKVKWDLLDRISTHV